MIKDIQNQINELANKLVTLTGNEEIASVRQQINSLVVGVGYSWQRTDKNGNDWYIFPLFNDLCAPFETVFITLEQNLRKNKKTGEWNFKPEKGDFILTIIKKTKHNVGRGVGKLKGYVPEEDYDIGGTGQPKKTKEPPDHKSSIVELENRILTQQVVAYIADLIIRQVWIKKDTNKQHFEGFFTHDRVTEERALQGEYITEEYSRVVFPAMCSNLLNHLMEGDFMHMRDLVINPVRERINLAQSIQNVENCYKMGTTGKYYHGKYKEWLKAIGAEVYNG